ncbi:exodeoxyribonuclease VII large subunit, partial [bacterium]|nr:exodeoxyribonuclease VII large subunit [bacterium]
MLQQHKKAYTISEITSIVKTALQSLTNIWIEGEISNLSRPTSGHIYFTLKDRLSQIKCVIFRSDLMYLRYVPKNGDKVFLHGRIDVYTRGGYHQIIGDTMEPAGEWGFNTIFPRAPRLAIILGSTPPGVHPHPPITKKLFPPFWEKNPQTNTPQTNITLTLHLR